MARRRMIDPNIWASEDMSKLTIRQRLLVIGLFSNADDHGKGIAKPAYVRSMVFSYDDIPLTEIIADIDAIREVVSIQLYEVEGNSYYKFCNWIKWQRVDKPQPSIIPEPFQNESRMNQESLLPKGKEEKGKEGEEKRKEGKSDQPSSDDFQKDEITKFIKEYNIDEATLYHMDILFSYIGVVDLEVIQTAMKKGQSKHVNYSIKALEGMVKEGKTTKESVAYTLPRQGTGKSGSSRKPIIPMFTDVESSSSVTDEELEAMIEKARRLDSG